MNLLPTERVKKAWRGIEALASQLASGWQQIRSEPHVHYQFAEPICRTSPAEVPIPVRGRLYYGTLDHRLSLEWLAWRRVTHVINTCGEWAYRRDPRAPRARTQEWTLLHRDENMPATIKFKDWCPTFAGDRTRAQTVFEQAERVLDDDKTVLFIHCKNGRDRSGVTVYMLLRILYSFSHDDALRALASRVGTNGGALLPNETLTASAVGRVSSMQFQ